MQTWIAVDSPHVRQIFKKKKKITKAKLFKLIFGAVFIVFKK